MSEGYEAFDDPYVYPGTSVLRNRLGIRDAAGLEGFEVEAAHFRAEEGLPEGNFDAAHFSAVHRHLFGDVYEWAGTYRTVRIAKGTTMFCYPENIPAQMDALFGGIEGGGRFRDVTVEEFVTRLAGFLAELNAIHPSGGEWADAAVVCGADWGCVRAAFASEPSKQADVSSGDRGQLGGRFGAAGCGVAIAAARSRPHMSLGCGRTM